MLKNLLILLLSIFLLFSCSKKNKETVISELSDEEKQAGWQLLFNGKDLTGWKCNNDKPIATTVEKGSLVPYKSGGYIIMHERPFDHFVLKCDVRWENPRCNSGIFFRVEDPKNPVHTGFEIQVMSGTRVGKHQFGAIYDLVATTKNAGKAPPLWLLKAFTYFHVFLHRLSGGLNTLAGKEMCFVTTTGARSGRMRVISLLHIPHKERVLLVASAGGAPNNPAWYHNLIKHPNIEIERDGEWRKFRAHLAQTEEKTVLWPVCYEHYAPYAEYRKRTARDIPIFICELRE